MWRKGNPPTLFVGMWAGTATLENSTEVPQKSWKYSYPPTHRLHYFRYLPQRRKCSDLKGHLYPNVHSSNIHNSQTVERAQMSSDRWVDKEDVVFIHNGILYSHQKWNLAIHSDVDETRGYYAKRNKSTRERQLSYDLADMWNLINKAEDHRGREGKLNGKSSESEKTTRDSWLWETNWELLEGREVGDGVAGWWTLGSVCVVGSAVYCIRLMNHRPVPLKQIIHYMLILKKPKK